MEGEAGAVSRVRRYVGDHIKFLRRYDVPLPKELNISGIHIFIERYGVAADRHEAVWMQALSEVKEDFKDLSIQGELTSTCANVRVTCK
jgi:hypothetical protein